MFEGGRLEATFVEDSFRDGDFLSLLSSEGLQTEEETVFRVVDNLRTRIGEYEIVENALIVRFGVGATFDDAQLVARHLAFGSTLDETSEDTRFLRLTATDASNGLGFDFQRISIAAGNLPPLIEFADRTTVFQLGGLPVPVDRDVEITDVDSEGVEGTILVASFSDESRREGDFLTFEATEPLTTEGTDIFEQRESGVVQIASFSLSASGVTVCIQRKRYDGIRPKCRQTDSFWKQLDERKSRAKACSLRSDRSRR